MRTVKMGRFDAAITIFNAVGHLTKADFEKSIRNLHDNLNEGGLYIFDIFNLNYLLTGQNISKLTIDWLDPKTNNRVIQYSTITKEGILASYTTSFEQKGRKVLKSAQTLQVYTVKQLKDMLSRNGFKILAACAIDGSKFFEKKSERILITAKRLKFGYFPIFRHQ